MNLAGLTNRIARFVALTLTVLSKVRNAFRVPEILSLQSKVQRPQTVSATRATLVQMAEHARHARLENSNRVAVPIHVHPAFLEHI